MNTDKIKGARQVYENMFEILCRRFHDYNKAWDCLIEFLTVDNYPALLKQLEGKLEWLLEDKDLADILMNAYKPKILKDDMHDYLGDMYVKHQSKLATGFKGIISHEEADSLAKTVIGETDRAINMLDPAVGTGRFLLAVSKYAPNGNLFGVESDIKLLRIAFTNCAIHGVKVCLLHADSSKHEIDISRARGRHNWQYANRWYSCWDHLKEITSERQARQLLSK